MDSRNTRQLGKRTSSKLQQISFIAAAFVLIVGCQYATGYSGGADPAVCDSMVPGHGSAPQNGPSPYTLRVSKTAVSGFDVIDITLETKSNSDSFHGFLIQVRKVGGDAKAVGEFKEDTNEANVKPLDCFDLRNSAMTHTSSSPKTSVTVQWVAPNDADAEYQVFYSVLKDYNTYWTRIPHEDKIRVTRNAQASTTAAPVQAAASQELLEKLREVYNGCGSTKGCFGIPGKCVEEFDSTSDNPTMCGIIVTWAKKGDKNEFELSGYPGGSQGYVAVGLSQDGSMGEDSVVGCVVSNANGEPTVQRYHNSGKNNEKFSNASAGLSQTLMKTTIDGHIFCKFHQVNHKINDLEIDFSKNYYLLLSRASRLSSTGLSQHARATDRDVSPQSVHISDNLIMGASANNWLIQLHGGLMIIAWLLCASTGMFTARYYKLTHTDFTPMGKAFWFALHVFCMVATVFLTICGAVFILIYKKGLALEQTHPILGVIVIGLAFLQVIIAFLRPHPGTPSRPYFNWFHWAVGNSAHIVGIICILFASDLNLADLKRFGDENLWGWILLGIVLFHVLMHIVMSIHTLWADKQMDASVKKRAMHPGPMKSNGLNGEAPGTGFRTFMLALYLLVMAAGAIALTALVFWPKSEDNPPTS